MSIIPQLNQQQPAQDMTLLRWSSNASRTTVSTSCRFQAAGNAATWKKSIMPSTFNQPLLLVRYEQALLLHSLSSRTKHAGTKKRFENGWHGLELRSAADLLL